MNSRIFTAIISLLFLSGCAELTAYRTENVGKMSGYFQKPEKNIMVVVESMVNDPYIPISMQCHSNNTSITDLGSHSQSFEVWSPYVQIYPIGQIVPDLQKTYRELSEADKKVLEMKMNLELPHIVLVCQSQHPSGLKGRVYFNGKEVSSDSSTLQYGMINLSYQLTLEELLK